MTNEEIKLAMEAVLIGFKAERFMTDADYTLQDKAVLVLQEALNASLAEQPIIKSYLEKDNSAQPLVVPDLLTTWDHETPEYRNGWNDCRQLMMEILRKNNG